MLRTDHRGYLALLGSSVKVLPADVVFGGSSVFWTGPHEALGISRADRRVEVVDLTTGTVLRRSLTQIVGYVEAVGGPWIAWMGDNTVHLSNSLTGKDVDTGLRGTAFPVVGDRFVLRADAAVYLLDPSAA
jgi:hypothetical protein